LRCQKNPARRRIPLRHPRSSSPPRGREGKREGDAHVHLVTPGNTWRRCSQQPSKSAREESRGEYRTGCRGVRDFDRDPRRDRVPPSTYRDDNRSDLEAPFEFRCSQRVCTASLGERVRTTGEERQLEITCTRMPVAGATDRPIVAERPLALSLGRVRQRIGERTASCRATRRRPIGCRYD